MCWLAFNWQLGVNVFHRRSFSPKPKLCNLILERVLLIITICMCRLYTGQEVGYVDLVQRVCRTRSSVKPRCFGTLQGILYSSIGYMKLYDNYNTITNHCCCCFYLFYLWWLINHVVVNDSICICLFTATHRSTLYICLKPYCKLG